MGPEGNCHVDPLEKAVDQEALARAETVVLRVSGMGCPTCTIRVRNSLLSCPGVVEVQIDLLAGLALVHYDSEQIEPRGLVQAVAAAGGDGHHRYQASVLG